MALILVAAVVVVAKTNPDLVKVIKRKATRILRTGDNPSLLSNKTRSDSPMQGEIEVRVMKVLSHGVDDKGNTWEIETGVNKLPEKEQESEFLAMERVGQVVAKAQQDALYDKIKFLIFDDKPEQIQLYVHAIQATESGTERRLASALVPVTNTLMYGDDKVTTPVILEGTSHVIADIRLELKFIQAIHSLKSTDHYSSFPSFGKKDRTEDLTKTSSTSINYKKEGWVSRLIGRQSKKESTADDDGYSAYL